MMENGKEKEKHSESDSEKLTEKEQESEKENESRNGKGKEEDDVRIEVEIKKEAVVKNEVEMKKETEIKNEIKEEEQEDQSGPNDDDVVWMRRALASAEEALLRGEVPVGCLFVYKNQVIATGNNTVNATKNATRHAEMNCIDTVLAWSSSNSLPYAEVFKEIKVVVTVEPCIMCAAALFQLEVPKIIFGCPNNRFGGCGSVFDIRDIHTESKCVIKGGIFPEESVNLLKTFYKGQNPNAPKPKVKKS